MATFNSCVRNQKKDGTYPVYIMIVHNRKIAYLRTSLVAFSKDVKKGEIKSSFIIAETSGIINKFISRLNVVDHMGWTVNEIRAFLESETEDISFTDFANGFVMGVRKEGRIKSANNYNVSVNNLTKFLGKKNVLFSDLTQKNIKDWIESLKDTARAKALYFNCVRNIFNSGVQKYNDYDRDIVPIKVRPFDNVKTPKVEEPDKSEKYVPVETIRRIMKHDVRLKYHRKTLSRDMLARDVVKMVLYLCGINLADLYDVSHDCFKDGKLCYNRKKTRGSSGTRAYIEVAIHPDILPLFEKYKGKERLFAFSEYYSTADDFTKAVNAGLKQICGTLKVPDVTAYYFRHTWATIAQNECGATDAEVAFCLDHASAHKVTTGYIRKKYTIVDEINKKVIRHIFNKRGCYRDHLICVANKRERGATQFE